jgi:Fe-S cluster assembly iron-binding protein IscA
MAIQLTESAAGHVRSMLSRRQGAIGLRLGTFINPNVRDQCGCGESFSV